MHNSFSPTCVQLSEKSHLRQQSPPFRALFPLEERCSSRTGCCPQSQEHAPLHPLLVAAVSKHWLRGHVDNQGHLVLRKPLLVPGTHSNTKNSCAPAHVLGMASPLPLGAATDAPEAEQGPRARPRSSRPCITQGTKLRPPPADTPLSPTGQLLSSISNICRAPRNPNASAQALQSNVQPRLPAASTAPQADPRAHSCSGGF